MSDRQMVTKQTLQQIGANILPISGGRALMEKVDGERYPDMILPVGSGYRVRISLTASDTYTVTREMKRGAKLFVKGVQTDVYAEDLSEVCYFASCYKNIDFGEHKATWS